MEQFKITNWKLVNHFGKTGFSVKKKIQPKNKKKEENT